MLLSRGWARSSLGVLLAGAIAAPSANAELLVVTTPGEPPALSHVEIALATGEEDVVTWLSLRIRRGPVAVVAALPEAAAVEPALDAWLSSLERTASPHVLPPRHATDCGKSGSFVPVRWSRSRGVGAEELRLTEPEDVLVALREHGLGDGVQLERAPRYVVWSWPVADGEETTRTLRFTGASAPLSFVPPAAWPVLVSTLSRGPQQWPGELGATELSVTFFAGQQKTDYVKQLEASLRSSGVPLLESRSSGNVLGWAVLANSISVPPLVRSYAQAAAEESDDVDAERCAQQLQALVGASACGRATDASLALAVTGARPVLQRFVVTGDRQIGPGSLQEGGTSLNAVLRASRVDESACPAVVPTPPIVVAPGSAGGSAPPAQGGTSPVVEGEPAVVGSQRDESCSYSPGRDPYYDDHYHSHSHGTWYCGGDTSSTAGDDSCSSDSSSSSSDDSCSGSSSSTSSSDDSCSSDSSSSSSDDSCSGGSGSSYDGDTCTGSGAPGAEPKASQASLTRAHRSRPQRLRLSFWSLAMAAVLLPIRRLKAGRVR